MQATRLFNQSFRNKDNDISKSTAIHLSICHSFNPARFTYQFLVFLGQTSPGSGTSSSYVSE